MKTLTLVLLLAATAAWTFAAGPAPVPEIDGNSAVAAIALVSGGLLVARARRRK